MEPRQLQDLVRRVVARALREPAAGERARAGGVHVASGASVASPRPSARAAASAPDVLTAEDLAGVADGGTLSLRPGARLTALAQDEARRRGIVLREERGGRAGLRVAIGADHGGFAIKRRVGEWLRAWGHAVDDLGTHDEAAVDYPDFAEAVARAVAEGRADLGVCVDGAGIGSAMAANKVRGARAAMCYDEATAKNAREHNFANVLSLGGPMLGEAACERILRAFVTTPEGVARHERRVEKIMDIEARGAGGRLPVKRVLPTPKPT
ncbi:MAG: RpiB/LacA/LacB family sugar-phosphate isomerase [Planctomycetes bacterium]|nr:RpiB/LacA/LacB family sugar-phosphate isomerase [Planctomycetota bacterium]